MTKGKSNIPQYEHRTSTMASLSQQKFSTNNIKPCEMSNKILMSPKWQQEYSIGILLLQLHVIQSNNATKCPELYLVHLAIYVQCLNQTTCQVSWKLFSNSSFQFVQKEKEKPVMFHAFCMPILSCTSLKNSMHSLSLQSTSERIPTCSSPIFQYGRMINLYESSNLLEVSLFIGRLP